MSFKVKAWLSVVVPEYSPGWRRKKNAIYIMLANDILDSKGITEVYARSRSHRTIVTGQGLTLLGGGSFLLQLLFCQGNLKSIFH